MTIKKFILFLLFLSYAFVLGHSIFHHDHHEENLYINSAEFHTSGTHGHSDEFSFHDFFKKYNHQGEKEIFTFSKISRYAKISIFISHSVNLNYDNLTTGKPPPNSTLSVENSVINSKTILYSHTGLRAPPLS